MDFRFKKIVPDWYVEWLNKSTEDKYEDAKEDYFSKHPNRSLSDFYLGEIEFWSNRLNDPKKYPINSENYDEWDPIFVVEVRKLLAHYKKLEQAKSKDESRQPGNTEGGEHFIKTELLQTLKDIETKIQPQIELWNKGKAKIKCASFVELLMDKHYFNVEYKEENLKSCTTFAALRYNCKIENQMLTKEKQNRNKHKEFLQKHFK